ncbi:V-type ATP synthase subunit E [Carnobacterium funditum]|uniref:V-type ATP synthase subunit E n=1 Tax=Carnobacterium funditum TaxID=2752 RepID=UPI000557F209|nr:ATPase [Carnobacterium funditum]
MSDLKLITDRMIDKKKAEIQEKIRQTELEAKETIALAEVKIEEEKVRQIKLIDKRLADDFEKNKNSLENQKRNKILAEKQHFLLNIFEKVQTTMEQWDETEFQQFLLSVLEQFKSLETIELVLGEHSSSKVSEYWLRSLTQQGIPVSLSSETISKKSGFIVKDQTGIQYNYLFDSLITEIKSQLIPSVSKKLF